MEKHALYHMTWKEIEEVFKNDPVVIIPMGSTVEGRSDIVPGKQRKYSLQPNGTTGT